MTMRSLAEEFASTRGAPIEIDGKLVRPTYEQEVKASGEYELSFEHAIDSPAQAVRLSVVDGSATIEGQRSKSFVLWRAVAPTTVKIRCDVASGKKRALLRIWNAWNDKVGGKDVTQAWLGNAGIIAEQISDAETVLRCSDGVGPFSPGDLVVRLRRLPDA